MRTNTTCPRCHADVRQALVADTTETVLLDPTPDPNGTHDVIHVGPHNDVWTQPLRPGTTRPHGRGLTYRQHACPPHPDYPATP